MSQLYLKRVVISVTVSSVRILQRLVESMMIMPFIMILMNLIRSIYRLIMNL